MVTSIFAALAPIIGGIIIGLIGDFRHNFLFINWTGYQILFLITVFIRYFPVIFLKKVEEPKVEKVEEVVRVVRSTIGVGLKEGMGTLIHYLILPVTTIQHFVEHLIIHDDKKGEK